MSTSRELTVPIDATSRVTAIAYEASKPRVGATLLLGHGAGADQRSAFMTGFANSLAALGVDAVTFNFLYTEQRRRLPDRAPLLESCYRAVIDYVRSEVASARTALFIGGKSMGGRIATQVAAADPRLPIEGIVLLGYPLHPPGRPGSRRDAHLPGVRKPMLFVQGSRDAFGAPAELEPVLDCLSEPATIYSIEGGDHSLKIGRAAGAEQEAVYANAQRAILDWMNGVKARAGAPRSGTR